MRRLSAWLYLLLAHLVADFMLQPYALVQLKRQPLGLAIHAGVHVVITGLLIVPILPRWWLVVPFLAVAHYLIDRVKVHSGRTQGPRSLLAFLADQLAHLGVLALAVVLAGLPLGRQIVVGSLAATGALYYAIPYVTATFAGAVVLYQIALAFHTRRRPEELLLPGPRVLGMGARAATVTAVLFLPPGLWWLGALPAVILLWGDRGDPGRRLEAGSGLALALAVGMLFR